MRRNFLTGLLVCLVPTLLAALFVGLATVRESQRRGRVPPRHRPGRRHHPGLPGGHRTRPSAGRRSAGRPARPPAEEPPDMKAKLAENLKRRIDPADLRNVVVRPLGSSTASRSSCRSPAPPAAGKERVHRGLRAGGQGAGPPGRGAGVPHPGQRRGRPGRRRRGGGRGILNDGHPGKAERDQRASAGAAAAGPGRGPVHRRR